MKAAKPLTQKQYNFVLSYVKNGFNASLAAKEAGYEEDNAYHSLIKNPEIKSLLDKAHKKAEDKFLNDLSMTYTWKLAKLKRVIEEYIPTDKDIKLNPNEVQVALKALSEVNKMQGDYAPDKRLSVTVDATKERLIEAEKAYEEY